MKFKVSIEVPDKHQQSCFNDVIEEALKSFEGIYTDSAIWDTDGDDSYILWFESEQPDLGSNLQNALVKGTIWSYSVRVWKEKGQSEQDVRKSS